MFTFFVFLSKLEAQVVKLVNIFRSSSSFVTGAITMEISIFVDGNHTKSHWLDASSRKKTLVGVVGDKIIAVAEARKIAVLNQSLIIERELETVGKIFFRKIWP